MEGWKIHEKIQRKYFCLFLVCATILLGCFGCNTNRYVVSMQLDWGISLPPPQKVEAIYELDSRDGEVLEVWSYTKEDLIKISETEDFELITDENISKVNIMLDVFREDLLNDIEKLNRFDSCFATTKIISPGNYYKSITSGSKPGCYALILLDITSNNLYYLSSIS